MITRTVILFLILSVTASVSTAATIAFDFVSSLLSLRPGQMATLTGTIQNTGTGTAFLNGDTVTSVAPLITDDSPFLLNAPASLSPTVQFTGPILTVSVPASAAFGLYSGSFRVLGGDTPSAFTVLAASTFAVEVVPEPGTLLSSAALLMIVAVALHGRSASL